jgi:hypothetical protein
LLGGGYWGPTPPPAPPPPLLPSPTERAFLCPGITYPEFEDWWKKRNGIV